MKQSDHWIYWKFGILFFIYSLGVSAAIQFYVIPILFPNFNLGDSLAVLDATYFNSVAKEKSIAILTQGWGAWELRPQGQSPAGVASIFYVLWVPKPYSVLPLNALVHALSGCLVLWILRRFFDWKPAIFGGALFVVNPAALEWVAQMHRDGYFILGNLMVLVCLLQMGKGLQQGKPKMIGSGFLFGLFGTAIAWVGRLQWTQVLFLIFVASICVIVFFQLFAAGKQDED